MIPLGVRVKSRLLGNAERKRILSLKFSTPASSLRFATRFSEPVGEHGKYVLALEAFDTAGRLVSDELLDWPRSKSLNSAYHYLKVVNADENLSITRLQSQVPIQRVEITFRTWRRGARPIQQLLAALWVEGCSSTSPAALREIHEVELSKGRL